MAQPCAKRVLSSTEIQISNGWFSAECNPPVPVRKADVTGSSVCNESGTMPAQTTIDLFLQHCY